MGWLVFVEKGVSEAERAWYPEPSRGMSEAERPSGDFLAGENQPRTFETKTRQDPIYLLIL